MIEAGQSLGSPWAAIGCLAGCGMIGIFLACWTLATLRSNFLLRLAPDLGEEAYYTGLVLGGALSIGLTLVLQATSLFFLDTTASLTGCAVRHVSQVGDRELSKLGDVVTQVGKGAVQGAGKSLTKNSRAAGVAIAVAVAAVLLLVVGAGYAFTALDLPFLGHFAAFAAGVALVEEFTKALAGLAILYLLMPKDEEASAEIHQRRVLTAFGIAGLGFGAGEALHYFGKYAEAGDGFGAYAVRAVWCVTLHGCWTLIAGRLIAASLPHRREDFEKDAPGVLGMVLLACIPGLLLHAFYNACCQHESGFLWVVGILTILTAAAIVEEVCEPADTSGAAAGPQEVA